MRELIAIAKESGKINPAILDNQVVNFVLYGQTKRQKQKQAYIQLPDMTFAMSGNSYRIANEAEIWQMRAAYLEKFPIVSVAEISTKKQLELMQEEGRIIAICTDFVKNFTGEGYRACYDDIDEYKAVLKDLENALSMYDYDSIAAVMTENDESFLQYFRLSRTFEGDFKTISQILAEFNIECRRIKKELTT